MKKMILSATLLVAAFSFATAQNVKNADKKENKTEQCAKDKKQGCVGKDAAKKCDNKQECSKQPVAKKRK